MFVFEMGWSWWRRVIVLTDREAAAAALAAALGEGLTIMYAGL